MPCPRRNTNAECFLFGPTGATGPTGQVIGVTGQTGPTGPMGPPSGVTGPTGPSGLDTNIYNTDGVVTAIRNVDVNQLGLSFTNFRALAMESTIDGATEKILSTWNNLGGSGEPYHDTLATRTDGQIQMSLGGNVSTTYGMSAGSTVTGNSTGLVANYDNLQISSSTLSNDEKILMESTVINPLGTTGQTTLTTNSLILDNALNQDNSVLTVLTRRAADGLVQELDLASASVIPVTSLSSSGATGVVFDDSANIIVTQTPTVQTLNATSSIITGTFNATDIVASNSISGPLDPDNINPGINGQILSTVLGTTTWVDYNGDDNIYNTDGTLTGNRTVNAASNDISFTNVDTLNMAGTLKITNIPSINNTDNNVLIRNATTGAIQRRGASTLPNIYTADGTLTGIRTVDLNSNQLILLNGSTTFIDTTQLQLGQIPPVNNANDKLLTVRDPGGQIEYRDVTTLPASPSLEMWQNRNGVVTNPSATDLIHYSAYGETLTDTLTIYITDDGTPTGTQLYLNLPSCVYICSGEYQTATPLTQSPIVSVDTVTGNSITFRVLTGNSGPIVLLGTYNGLKANTNQVRVHVIVVGPRA